LDQYKSLTEPKYWFTRQAMVMKPYQLIVDALQQEFVVQDLTSFNIDVSFRYLLTAGEEQWVLELSMVEPYAVLLRLDRQEPPLTGATVSLSDSERRIVNLLTAFNIVLLEKEILEQPIDLVLFNTEPEYVRLYQALFADTWLLPWEPYEAPSRTVLLESKPDDAGD
jgi:hypothetical protein